MIGWSTQCAESIKTARGRGRARAQAPSSPTQRWSSSSIGEPCARKIAGIAFVVFLVAAFHNPGRAGAAGYALLQLIIGGAGAGFAARQVWLQSLPKDQVPACGMGLDYMLDTLPFTDVLRKVFEGSGECAEKAWEFLHLSIAGWTLVFFIAMTAVSFALIRRDR